MRKARVLNANGVDYISILGYNQGDTNLLFKVDEAYDILKKSLNSEEAENENITELKTKVNILEGIIKDLVRTIDKSPEPIIFVAKDDDEITKIKNFFKENTLDI